MGKSAFSLLFHCSIGFHLGLCSGIPRGQTGLQEAVGVLVCVFTAKVWGLGAAPGWILTNRGVRGGTEDSPRDDGQSRPAAQHTGTADFFGQQPSLLGS